MSKARKNDFLEKNRLSSTPYSHIPWSELNFERQLITVNNQTNKVIAKCLICNKNLQNTGYKRLQAHRNVCKEKTVSTDSHMINLDISEQFTGQNIPNSTTNQNPQDNPEPQISNFESFENLSETDEHLGMFFFGCGIPFAVVENEYFLKFVKRLNPNYKPPSRKTLSNSILNNVYDKLINKQSSSEPQESVLLIDGWKNKNKNEKYVVASIHNADGKKLFLNSWDFTESSETAVNLKKVVEEATIDAKAKYNAEIYAVASDNVSSMICMGKMLDHWHVTCNSHSGNLLAKDLLETDFNKKAHRVLKEFKSSNLEKKIIDRGGVRILLPGETRWCSYRDSYRCILRNLDFMRQIVTEVELQDKQEVVNLILDKKFEDDLQKFTIILDGPCKLINECQKADSNIADAVEEWLKLEFPLHDENYELILNARLKKVLKPINLAANILHPIYMGQLFSTNQDYNEMANNFFKQNLTESGLADLAVYKAQEGIFSVLKEKSIDNPETFWTFAQPHHPSLSLLAKKLMRIPSSTAEIERIFSQWAFIHSKLRNRLGQEKSKKLIYIYYTLKVENVFVNDQF